MRNKGLAAILGVALLLTAGAAAALFALYRQEQGRNAELLAQIETLSQEENRSAVVQSINAQMEEIATQERRVSDMQREEAIQQRRVAEEERQNAERQRQQAELQRQNAIAAEKKAVEASGVAQHQQAIAEQQRAEAEAAKRVADTLSYNAMARSLAAQAATQATAGNTQLAALLAYAAYTFASEYKGDVYNSAIYSALSLTSASNRKWNIGRGAVAKIWAMPGSDDLITVSTYGEIMRHTKNADGDLRSVAILKNSAYDFRDMVVGREGTIYALSHTGHLVHGKAGGPMRVTLIGQAIKPLRLFMHSEGQLLVVAEQSVHLIDAATMEQKRELPLGFQAAVAGEDDKQLLVFDRKGKAYTVDYEARSVKPRRLPFEAQPIMSYTYNRLNGYEAYGTVEGPIFIAGGKGGVKRLVGHGSRVSRVMFDGDRIYSTGYDGTVRFWQYTRERVEPMKLVDSRQWVVSFTFDKTRNYIWTGDQNGNLTETLVDPHIMATRVRDRLKREFTQEEWNYYVGKEIPYRKMK